MPSPEEVRAQFAEMMARPEAELELARAALLVAAESDPTLDPDTALERLRGWADQLASRIEPGWNSLQRLARLRAFVYDELGFRGNRRHYHDPMNSRLDAVLERRLGIPLTLAIVLLELGWRVDMPLEGVGMPGHFLVRLAGLPEDLLLDPFDHAGTVDRDEAAKLLAASTGGTLQLDEGMLRSVGKRAMILRLLGNLKQAWLRLGDLPQALGAVERLRLIDPEDPGERRDQGLLLYELDRYREAKEALADYLERAPDAKDRDAVQRQLGALSLMLAADGAGT